MSQTAESNDWKDIANWDIDLLPDPCSYVIIPGGLRHYPVINKLDSAVCDIIDFKFGGEVKNTHLLTYNAAKVEMNLNSKQWYMLSAPLGDLYSGDFYVTDPNPFVDGYKIYAMLFNAENPQSHKTVEATWTGTFNTANQLLTKGTGMTIWAENEDVPQMTTNFTFPKPDASYNYYFGNGNVSGTTGPISRTNSSRFAYDEPGFDAAVTTKITLPFPTVRAGEAFMVGNPFMTHLDFEAFYNENQTSILNEYSVATGVSTFDPRAISPFSTYIVGGATTGPVVLTKDIAPMQSFIVKSKVNSPNLRADVEFHTETSSNTLRSSAEIYRPDYTLEITSEREQKPSSRILVSYAGNASPEYVPEEDSYTLFSSNSLTPVILYTRSADGYALNVNASNDLGRIVPLGIRTSQTGEIHLKFAGLESFKNEVKIYLHDTRLNRVMDLDATAEYVFNKEEEALYSEDRFFLSFRSATGIGQLNATTGLIVRRTAPLTIQVSSSDGSMLTHLQITNLQGQSPVRATNVPSGSTYRVHKPGVYIVRATGKDYTQVEKIVVY
ncbi:hypothetical protein FACS1894145_5090 [Bacteroidia bacterium]|nr:hypothetical protein FACS1894145_5090 [Bacteroidia bacterium]